MFQKLAMVLALSAGLLSSAASALGLGEIQLGSGLNQPLSATIPLTSLSADEAESLQIRLATQAEYDRAGVERIDYLTTLNFTVSGTTVKVGSTRIARDPVISLLVEARAGNSRVVRGYTLLLDLPGETPSSASSSTSLPVTPAAPAAVKKTPVATPAPVRRTPAADEAPAARAGAAVTPSESAQTYGPVRAGQTFWSVAIKLRPRGAAVSVDQTLLALYTANPQAFLGGFDGLLEGAILQVPSAEAMQSVPDAEAHRRVLALRQNKAAVPASAVSAEAAASGAGAKDQKTETASASPVASGTSAPADSTSIPAAPAATTTDAAAAAVSTATADTPAPADTQGAQASASTASPDAQAQAPTSTPAAVAPPAADATPPAADASATEPSSSPTTASPTDAAVPPAAEPSSPAPAAASDTPAAIPAPDATADTAAAKPAPASAPIPAYLLPPRPVDPTPYFQALGLSLLAVFLIVLLWLRRRQSRPGKAATVEQPVVLPTVAPTPAPPVVAPPVPELEEETASDPADSAPPADAAEAAPEPELEPQAAESTPVDLAPVTEAAAPSLDQLDPVAEADFHLSYGLYDEAVRGLLEASEREPDRTDLQIKLAETYFASSRAAEFEALAARLQNRVRPSEWGRLVFMGSQLCPESALFRRYDEESSADFGGPARAGNLVEFSLQPPVAAPVFAPEPEPGNRLDFAVDSPAPGASAPMAMLDLSSPQPARMDDLRLVDLDPAEIDLFEPEPESQIATDDEVGTKLDLARAYADMGDDEMARVLLSEVLEQGSDTQRADAQALLARIPH